jgi:hypothetical protein
MAALGLWSFCVVATALAGAALAGGCTVVVDTSELQKGDEGLGCDSQQKVCPDPKRPGRGACVSLTNPSYGCSSDSCASCSVPNAAARCANNGECAIATCQNAHYDCNGQVEDGCEIDLGRDEHNCGSCKNVCRAANGATACASGECVVVYCSEPFGNCDGKYSNGCETDLSTSQQHCGACKSPCAGSCEDGTCKP